MESMMKTNELRYYGKPFTVTMIDNDTKTWLISTPAMSILMIKELGFLKTFKILKDWKATKKQLNKIDFSTLNIKGENRDRFIMQRIKQTAIFMAMEKSIGLEKTINLHHQFMDKVGLKIQKLYNPPQEELKTLKHPFEDYMDFLIAEFEAEKEAGLHDFEIVEQTDETVRINVTYCAFCEIPKMCGIKEACEPGCYSDEVFFPNYLRALGIQFERTNTIARGGEVCDFKFIKLKNFPIDKIAKNRN